MEYIFGMNGNKEILKTKGKTHSDLKGYRQVKRVFPDRTITDCFFAAFKYKSAEDSEGNCYDWYEIKEHYRTSDSTKQVKDSVNDLSEALKNSYESLFDGLKFIASRENPIPLKLPMVVKRNLIYLYNGKLYVALTDGIAEESSFDGFFAED